MARIFQVAGQVKSQAADMDVPGVPGAFHIYSVDKRGQAARAATA